LCGVDIPNRACKRRACRALGLTNVETARVDGCEKPGVPDVRSNAVVAQYVITAVPARKRPGHFIRVLKVAANSSDHHIGAEAAAPRLRARSRRCAPARRRPEFPWERL